MRNQPREPLAPAPIEPVRLGVFVNQPLDLARLAGPAAVDERRRQVSDGHRGDPALCLRRLPGIADDEGIDHRKRADDQFGKAGAGQRHGLAGQPFERAVGAHVDECIGLGDVPKPKPEREQRVPWRQGRIVVVRSAIVRTSAVRRKCHQHASRMRARGSGTHRPACLRRPQGDPIHRASVGSRRSATPPPVPGRARAGALRRSMRPRAGRAASASLAAHRQRRNPRSSESASNAITLAGTSSPTA